MVMQNMTPINSVIIVAAYQALNDVCIYITVYINIINNIH